MNSAYPTVISNGLDFLRTHRALEAAHRKVAVVHEKYSNLLSDLDVQVVLAEFEVLPGSTEHYTQCWTVVTRIGKDESFTDKVCFGPHYSMLEADGFLLNGIHKFLFCHLRYLLTEEESVILKTVKDLQRGKRAKDSGWVAAKDLEKLFSPKLAMKKLAQIEAKGVLLINAGYFNGRRFKVASSILDRI